MYAYTSYLNREFNIDRKYFTSVDQKELVLNLSNDILYSYSAPIVYISFKFFCGYDRKNIIVL
jgi:hypothetical protein